MSTVYTDFAGLPVSARLCEFYLPKAPGTRPCPVGPPEEPHPLLMGEENISLRLFKMPFFCFDHPTTGGTVFVTAMHRVAAHGVPAVQMSNLRTIIALHQLLLFHF